MATELFSLTTEEILSFNATKYGSTRSLLLESQDILDRIEQINLRDETQVDTQLKRDILDFMARCGWIALDVHGRPMLNPELYRLTTARALDWIYDCQDVLLGHNGEDEFTTSNQTTEES
jgi:hypothetical protein